MIRLNVYRFQRSLDTCRSTLLYLEDILQPSRQRRNCRTNRSHSGIELIRFHLALSQYIRFGCHRKADTTASLGRSIPHGQVTQNKGCDMRKRESACGGTGNAEKTNGSEIAQG